MWIGADADQDGGWRKVRLLDMADPIDRPRRSYAGPEGSERAMFQAALSKSSLHRFRSEEHTSELQSLMRISYAVFCLKKKKHKNRKLKDRIHIRKPQIIQTEQIDTD